MVHIKVVVLTKANNIGFLLVDIDNQHISRSLSHHVKLSHHRRNCGSARHLASDAVSLCEPRGAAVVARRRSARKPLSGKRCRTSRGQPAPWQKAEGYRQGYSRLGPAGARVVDHVDPGSASV